MLDILLLVVLGIGVVIFFVYYLINIDWETDVDQTMKSYKKELERARMELELNNKKINEIEQHIFYKKRKLNRLQK